MQVKWTENSYGWVWASNKTGNGRLSVEYEEQQNIYTSKAKNAFYIPVVKTVVDVYVWAMSSYIFHMA